MARALDARTAAALMLALAAATIAAAWAFELIGGYIPCKLCLQERYPYYAALPVLLAAVAPVSASLRRLLIAVAGLIFVAGFALGAYHAGVEWGWWPGPSDCGVGGSGEAATAEDLLRQLEGIRVVSCSEASWRFPEGWGLSFAGWNAALSAALVAIAAWAVLRPQGSSSVSQ